MESIDEDIEPASPPEVSSKLRQDQTGPIMESMRNGRFDALQSRHWKPRGLLDTTNSKENCTERTTSLDLVYWRQRFSYEFGTVTPKVTSSSGKRANDLKDKSSPEEIIRRKSLENSFNMFKEKLEHLEHEGLIRLDQFEDWNLTPLVSSDFNRIFNQVSLPYYDSTRFEPHTDRKIFESSFQNIQDLIKRPSQSPRNGPTVETYPMDPILPDNVKRDSMKPKHETNVQNGLSELRRHLRSLIEAIIHVLRCTTPHLIRRMKFEIHLPYLGSRGINQQRLFPFPCCCDLDVSSMNLDVPKYHGFTPKLSRLKPSRNLPYLARLLHKFTNGHIHLFCTIFFHFLSI